MKIIRIITILGTRPEIIRLMLNCTKVMLAADTDWEYPIGYTDKNVSDKIVKFMNDNLDF